jgi:hypothetical protein
MPITVPTKTEESLGIEKSDNVPEGVVLDPRHWTTAAQLEAMKTKIIELCQAFNGLEAGGAVLYDMPIAEESVGTPVRYRSSADSGTPEGTPAVSVVGWESYPSGQSLRLRGTGLAGGLVWPILHGLTLPSEYVVELALSGMDADASNMIAVVLPFCDFFAGGGEDDTVRGLVLEHQRGLQQVDRRTIDMVSSEYTRVLGSGIGDTCQWPTSPDYPAGLHHLRIHVARAGGLTPARWVVHTEHRSAGTASAPSVWSMSGADSPQSQLNGLTFDDIGIGVFGTGASDMNIDIARLRIRSV